MKRYALLMLWPTGFSSANKVIAETKERTTKEKAIDHFRFLDGAFASLDSDGYAKVNNDVTYCVAECYESY